MFQKKYIAVEFIFSIKKKHNRQMYRESFPENALQIGRLDEEFIRLMTEIEKHYTPFNKHERIRVEQWCKKLCQVAINKIWKQNRNHYAFLLLHCILEGTLTEPFNKIPPEDYLPSLNKHAVVYSHSLSLAKLKL